MPHAVPDGSASRLMPRWEDAHPWLVSAIVVVSLGARNVKWVTLTDVLIVLGEMWLAVTATFLVLWLIRRSARHAALLTSWLCLLGSYYGVAFDVLTRPSWANSDVLRHGVLLALGIGVSAVIWRLTGDLKPFCRFLSLTTTIAATSFALSFGHSLAREPRSKLEQITSAFPAGTAADASQPDVYYIILDAYARGDVFQKYYSFDNSEFLNGLRQRGFYIADKSCTNYPGTLYSLPSSLNMRYHGSRDGIQSFKPLAEMVRAHEVGLRLRERGYKLVHFNTHFMSTACSDIAHFTFGEQSVYPAGCRMLTLHMIGHSALRFVNGGERAIYAAEHRRALEQLREVPKLPGPKFTFFHLVAPHPPYVLDRDGNAKWNIDQDDRSSYVDQVVYINREITRAVDAILANSAVPPVIIIQSDHGPGYFAPPTDLADSAGDVYVQERIPILNAYLVPETMRDKLYPTITPVNSFRLLLTECFGYNYPPLPDRHFMFLSEAMAKFVEVTSRVHDGLPDLDLARPRPGQKFIATEDEAAAALLPAMIPAAEK